ncbi:hypothetical protein QGM71_21130 [Virgibacillus sp. C22-A2]|uniref:Uncharacterized protein n=1 Tax=Virgibacillus tibetensis TaxID=3042313 RepID=A0ABU6KMZ3_9BACI|nr:hypothetical protein [Virgibacillus sp. C22-A2]
MHYENNKDNPNQSQTSKSKKKERNQQANNKNGKETVLSEKLRYKNADEIYD